MGRSVILFFVLFAFSAYAQPADLLSRPGSIEAASSAQDKLDYTLNTLKDSVTRLSGENAKLASGNDQIRVKIRALNDELKLEQAQGDKINAQLRLLDPAYQKKAEEHSSLEEQFKGGAADLAGLNSQRATLEEQLQIKDVESSALTAQSEALSRELSDIRTGLVPGEDHTAELEALRAEQQSAQQALDAYTIELDRLRAEWKDLVVFVNAGPGQGEALTQEQAALKSDMIRRTQEIDGLRQKLAVAVKESDDVSAKFSLQAVAQLEQDIQALEAKAKGLEKEAAEAEKAIRTAKTALPQDAKLKKDEARFKELFTRNRDLSMGLRNLQRSMVSMDKKKALLEKEMGQVR